MDSQGSLGSQDSQDSVLTVVDESKREILYFAYGADLSTDRMRRRCPFSAPVGLGYLAGWRWTLRQRGANVVRVDGPAEEQGEDEGVYGLLYLLPTQDEEVLDMLEGVPLKRGKIHVEVSWLMDGQGKVVEDDSLTLVKALIYVDAQGRSSKDDDHEEYVVEDVGEDVGELERGIRDVVENWGFPEEYAYRVRACWRSV